MEGEVSSAGAVGYAKKGYISVPDFYSGNNNVLHILTYVVMTQPIASLHETLGYYS